MKLCKNCQEIPEEYEQHEWYQKELPKAISMLMDEHNITMAHATEENITCSHCTAVYAVSVYTDVFRVEFSLKRISK